MARKIVEREALYACVNIETGNFVPNQLYQTNKYSYPTEYLAKEQFKALLQNSKYKIVKLTYKENGNFL